MKRILLFSTIFTLLVLPCFAQKAESLSNTDYAQIIRAILLDQRFEKRTILPDKDRLVVYLSTENINPKLVPSKINGVRIELKTPQQIEKEKENWRSYCAFGEFATKGSTVIVDFFDYGKNTEDGEFILASMEYEYRKTAGKWKMVSKTPDATFGF